MTQRGFLFSTDAIAAAVILIIAISVVSLSLTPSTAVQTRTQDALVDQSLMVLYHHEKVVPLQNSSTPTHFCRSAFFVKDQTTMVRIDNGSTTMPGVICQ